jgi:hypothetical protein
MHLATGPGGIGLIEADSVVAAGFNRDRDLVVMNQRGTYLSDPAPARQSMISPGSFSAVASIPSRPSVPIWPPREPATGS